MSNLVANKLVQQAQAEEIQLLLEKVIERVKETPAGNIQVRTLDSLDGWSKMKFKSSSILDRQGPI